MLGAVADLAAAAVLHARVAALTPRQKAALVVISGLPAPEGVGGVLVKQWDTRRPRPSGAIVFVDQEGGNVRSFPQLPPAKAARGVRSTAEAYAAGRAAGAALWNAGVGVDLAPVLDTPDGPLGSREFRDPSFGVAFARGLQSGKLGEPPGSPKSPSTGPRGRTGGSTAGPAACAKHFPGLGSTPVSTDDRPHVDGTVRPRDLAPFRAAIRAGVRCVMVGNAFYPRFGRFRASLAPAAYSLLRSLGFRGLAITDSLSLVRSAPVERWAPQALRAGADMVLFTSPAHAARAIRGLLPLARAGVLDDHVARVLALRDELH
ncbi:MAG TPA: glycoside hydrolase family 3 N-terminal domain-containing protein [Gaiellaceae bacterium]